MPTELNAELKKSARGYKEATEARDKERRQAARPAGGDASDLAKLLEQILAFRYRPRLVRLGPAYLAFAVDQESRALVHAAIFIEHAERLADRAVRPVVGQQGERYAAEVLRPRLERRRGVGAELQDLGVQLLEFFVVRTEPVDLVGSPPGERKRQEGDHDAPPAIACERYFLVGVSGEGEVGRLYASLQFHGVSPPMMYGQAVAEA